MQFENNLLAKITRETGDELIDARENINRKKRKIKNLRASHEKEVAKLNRNSQKQLSVCRKSLLKVHHEYQRYQRIVEPEIELHDRIRDLMLEQRKDWESERLTTFKVLKIKRLTDKFQMNYRGLN